MSENGMDIPGEEEDDDISPDLLRGLLKKTKKFEEGEVASLLGYDLNDEDEAKHVGALLGALKDNGYFRYKLFKESPGKDVTALADLDTVGFGHKEDIRTLHRVLNKKLPPMLPVARRTGGAGTQPVDPVFWAMAASQQVSADAAKTPRQPQQQQQQLQQQQQNGPPPPQETIIDWRNLPNGLNLKATIGRLWAL